MSLELEDHPTYETNDDAQYFRVMCLPAVIALILAVVSLPALIFPGLLFVPLIALVCGAFAVKAIWKAPEELSGIRFAWAGISISLFTFLGGTTIATTIYITELPPGHIRISFADLQPDQRRPDLPVSPRALELDGQKVFVKGYAYPDDRGEDLWRFVLVPDMGTCCFGGQPKLTDMMEVTLVEPAGPIQWSMRRLRLGGTLKVDTTKKPISGLDGVYYQLEADILK